MYAANNMQVLCPYCKGGNPPNTFVCQWCTRPQPKQRWEHITILRTRGYRGTFFGAGAKEWTWQAHIEIPNMAELEDPVQWLGETGWELVTVVPRSSIGGTESSGFTSEELWVFKRPKM